MMGLLTAKYVSQVFEGAEEQRSRLKASQCFTKYKWRSREAAAAKGGPEIIATQASRRHQGIQPRRRI